MYRAIGRRGGPMPSLPEEAFRRTDEAPDEEFYRTPRLVTHIDDRAIAAVTQLYRELFPSDGEILDLMSSWVSHLPPEIDYLTRPVEVLREVGRVLKGGAPVAITFSNRCFPTKAVEIWHRLDDAGHMQLVEDYFREADNFDDVRSLDRSPRRRFSDPLYAVVGTSKGPFAEGPNS